MSKEINKLKRNILDLCRAFQIHVVSFTDSSAEDLLVDKSMELTIQVDVNEEGKWKYFERRVNDIAGEKCNYVKSYWDGEQCTFTFEGNDNKYEREVLIESLSCFITGLRRRFFQVNPLMNHFSVLVKPTHDCDLDCKYCYDKPYREKIKKTMSMETLDKLCSLLSNYATKIQFIWHGGEPTMVGQDWYHKAYKEVFVKYPMVDWDFTLMSNGVKFALDPSWLDVFDRYGIDPGMSYNCLYQENLRTMSQDRDSLEADMELAKKLEKVLLDSRDREKGCLGVIDVISGANYADYIKIYEWYARHNISVSLNHVFHTENTEKNGLEVDAQKFADAFLRYFKHWLYDSDGVRERSANSILSVVLGNPKVTCRLDDCRYRWLSINPLGQIYPCDRWYPEQYRCGDVMQYDNLIEVFASEGYTRYVREIQERFDGKCAECGYWDYCKGGCNGSAIGSKGDATDQEDFFCELMKRQFDGVYDILRDLDFVKDIDKLNSTAKKTILESHVYTVKEIKEFLLETGKGIELDYDKNDLLNCSEYSVFRGVNPMRKNRGQYPGRHQDIKLSAEEETVLQNKATRMDELREYLRDYVKDMTK